MLLGSGRYPSPVAGLLDNVAFVLSYPWLTIASLTLSCYQSTPWEEAHPQTKLTHYFVYGPALAVVSVVFLPLGLVGLLLSVLICHMFRSNNYIHMVTKHNPAQNGVQPTCTGLSPDSSPAEACSHPTRKFTFCSANVLLAPECVVRFNKNKFVYTRAPEIARRLLWQHARAENAQSASVERHVSTLFPEVDFFCVQEVWERVWALVLIKELRQKYSHFIYDVGEYKLHLNGCIAGSGLFFCSKYPILEKKFETFKCRKRWAKCISYGVLCVKVDVGSPDENRVGYIANLHTQAYQDKEPIIYQELEQAHATFDKFVADTLQSKETCLFRVICGDFNYDNTSPGDAGNQHHPLFEEYRDFCRARPGLDKPWAVGTEMRQVMMFDERLNDPRQFRAILCDDVERRRFILDADVERQTLALASAPPPVDSDGQVRPTASGGRRRIDHILHHRQQPLRVLDYTFVTALGGLTDHVPVAMTVETT